VCKQRSSRGVRQKLVTYFACTSRASCQAMLAADNEPSTGELLVRWHLRLQYVRRNGRPHYRLVDSVTTPIRAPFFTHEALRATA
jgi:hypothetical protein